MTHDELLEKVQNTLGNYIKLRKYGKRDIKAISYAIDSLKALRAVVEMHKPYTVNGIFLCEIEPLPYPCPTVLAIEKELSVG